MPAIHITRTGIERAWDLSRATILVSVALAASLAAEDQVPSPPARGDGNSGNKTLKFPGLSLDVAKGRIEARGRICLDKGMIEYVACTAGGKLHETLLVVDCKPENLLAAMQTMGLKPGKGVDYQGERRIPTGEKVRLFVEWEQDGKAARRRVEDLVWNLHTKKPMKQTPWIFVGSKFEKDPDTGKPVLMAALEGSIAASYHDPYAIFDHPLETGADDTVYSVNTKVTPKAGTPIRFVILRDEPNRKSP